MVNELMIHEYSYNQRYECNNCGKTKVGTLIHNSGVSIKDVSESFSDLVKWKLLPADMPLGWNSYSKDGVYIYNCGCDPKRKYKGETV